MKNHLHFALQSAQWGAGSILDAEFAREYQSEDEVLRCIKVARGRLMDALDRLSTYQAELSGEKISTESESSQAAA